MFETLDLSVQLPVEICHVIIERLVHCQMKRCFCNRYLCVDLIESCHNQTVLLKWRLLQVRRQTDIILLSALSVKKYPHLQISNEPSNELSKFSQGLRLRVIFTKTLRNAIDSLLNANTRLQEQHQAPDILHLGSWGFVKLSLTWTCLENRGVDV